MFFTILVVISIYWLLSSLFALYNIKKIFKFYSIQPKIQLKQKWKAILRSDFGKWNQKAIIIGCFTRFPYHVAVLGSFLISFVILIPLSRLFGKRGRYYCIKFQKFWGNFATRQAYNIIQPINYIQYQIQTPIVISNHVNWFDIWFVGISLLPISIVSKAIIKKIPILGTLGDFFQAIYVQRNNQNQRNTIVDQINSRVYKWIKWNNNKKNIKSQDKYEQKPLPIIIFPQGTTSNGRSIMTFKGGAFNSLAPITIFALKYDSQQFQMGMGDIPQSHHAIISLCLKPILTVSHKIVYPLQNQTADEYCKRCRNIMSQMTGYEQVQCGFRDSMEYENKMNQERKKLKLN